MRNQEWISNKLVALRVELAKKIKFKFKSHLTLVVVISCLYLAPPTV